MTEDQQAPDPVSAASSGDEGMRAPAPDPTGAAAPGGPRGESLTFEGMDIPIVRANMPELFLALRPPEAAPYIMAPRDMNPQVIVDFFGAHIPSMMELRREMLKRYEKSPGRKCRYQTGDVAYVMGRPFQLRVYPLSSTSRKVKAGARGRATAKYSVDGAISLITLYVVHPRNFDEARLAFQGYGQTVLLNNAVKLAADFAAFLLPDRAVPPVRMRAMRGRWASSEAGALWLSDDLIPYPPDCLVYVLWHELAKESPLPPQQIEERFQSVLPGWREAARLLAERPEPFSLQ